ncbi:MAG: multidrug resistance protein [Gammaproteobacteria bacterium]|nr:MAG: multidrug efflux protein [Pseudomonadota bacterium]MBC6944378.1 multidrug efflux protein [Gammaproteobacteria bacterium]MCE7895378.1 multidrug efflux protein [Gammaproteobacteria bacterium PRO8]MDL1881286.1 multidrug efflux protein [Gammaproteobacteria bacterium PRO2]
MKFTDIFIQRPVLATVASLLILVLGLRSAEMLRIQEFPSTQSAVITVTTTYFGASPDLVASFITAPIESAVSQATGIDYIVSSSRTGVSTVTVNLLLNWDPNKALNEISIKVNSIRNQLPPESQLPVITLSLGQQLAAMYIGFASEVLAPNQITDYVARLVQPRLQALQGVQSVDVIGAQNIALRAWLDPQRLAAYGLTASDITQALAANNFLSSLGRTQGDVVQVGLVASTGLHSLEEFRNLIVRQSGGAIVRLQDVANVTLGSEDYESGFAFNGRDAVALAVNVAPGANLLETTAGVQQAFRELHASLPGGLEGEIIYDSAEFVRDSINEVAFTIVEALFIVTLVVFLFLGSPRSVLIPVVAIPLSLVGAFTLMLAAGFSFNLLTLLALVLAIGLVVDDAIIVVENVNRHIEEGIRPLQAALLAARELGGPIIAMGVVLVAVYVPIGFQGGLTGALFTEFAFTLVAAVVVSTIIALVLSPMMCARLLRPLSEESGWAARFEEFSNRGFGRLRQAYERALHASLDTVVVTLVFAGIVLVSIVLLYGNARKELAPQEDQGFLLTMFTSAPNATHEMLTTYSRDVYRIVRKFPVFTNVFQFEATGSVFAGTVMKPWSERSESANELMPILQKTFDEEVAGLRGAVFQLPPLPGAQGMPVEFVLTSTDQFPRLNEVAQAFLAEAVRTGQFMFLDSDLRIDQPQATVNIDRDAAARLGLQMSDIGGSLSAMLGGGYVNYFALAGRSYKVMPQAAQRFRLNADQLNDYYLRTPDGTAVPLSTVASIDTTVVPRSLNRFQQLNAATISGIMMPGVSLGDALDTLNGIAARMLPQGYGVDFAGQSRQYVRESSGFLVTIAFAMVIIFLALAALFESFRDPLIILISVPMSIAGALIFVSLGFWHVSLNIYTQVGLVTLMGLISKHGILIVEFANKLQQEGHSRREAVEQASAIRLRPILMTTAAMVLGVLPLLVATGAGAASRFNLGLVIFTGISIGTLFTLFVVPAVYLVLAADHHRASDAATPTA